jgi:hypothetical protein
MSHALRLASRRVGDGGGRAGVLALLRAAALAVMPPLGVSQKLVNSPT